MALGSGKASAQGAGQQSPRRGAGAGAGAGRGQRDRRAPVVQAPGVDYPLRTTQSSRTEGKRRIV